MIVAREAPTKCPKCGGARLEQDTDVLDTWFSSGLLPFTTLGWPEATRDLDVFYPTSLLITGFDILFFWVARMIMLGCWFMMPPEKPARPGGQAASREEALRNSVPFREVHIHALVRDAERQKMSKTKGNVLDPIEVIEQYGTDATRFTLAAMAAPGTDIAFNPSRTEGYRNFANKIWNAARFMFMNMDRVGAARVPSSASPGTKGIPEFRAQTLEDRWILSRFNGVADYVNAALEDYRFHEAANRIYDFFWGEFCDWYIELIKPRLMLDDGDKGTAEIAASNLVAVFEASLRLLHPVMPFITEEIWHAIYDGKPPLMSIALAVFPQGDSKQQDLRAETHMAILQDLIVSVRNLRAELKVETKTKTPIQVYAHEPEIRTLFEENRNALARLANVETITFVDSSLAKLPGSRHTARFDVHLVYEQKVDVEAECARLRKELEKFEEDIASADRQLNNAGFLAKAPANVVEGRRKQKEENESLRDKSRRKFEELGCK
jgi:valyl-tRNA synthetase